MILLETFVALAVTAAAEQRGASDPARISGVAGRTLEALPSTTIRYYDVAGANLTAVNASIAAQAPKDSVSKSGSPSSSDWSITVSFDQKISGRTCAITAARARFAASVLLPRLINEQALTREERKVWDQYVAVLKANAAAELWFVQERIGEVEKAILASGCDDATQSATAAAEKIKRELAKYARLNKRSAPTIMVPVRDTNDPRS